MMQIRTIPSTKELLSRMSIAETGYVEPDFSIGAEKSSYDLTKQPQNLENFLEVVANEVVPNPKVFADEDNEEAIFKWSLPPSAKMDPMLAFVESNIGVTFAYHKKKEKPLSCGKKGRSTT
eukprot:UN00937